MFFDSIYGYMPAANSLLGFLSSQWGWERRSRCAAVCCQAICSVDANRGAEKFLCRRSHQPPTRRFWSRTPPHPFHAWSQYRDTTYSTCSDPHHHTPSLQSHAHLAYHRCWSRTPPPRASTATRCSSSWRCTSGWGSTRPRRRGASASARCPASRSRHRVRAPCCFL